ncbi:hypothetical protein Daus18300_001132 [Diaporthe australafricana]|uniref:Uncharacterized protein n=1 Tax=Diaporthe australafricana TaxID=127596 RepID=A0ABR3Y029_9PEZI
MSVERASSEMEHGNDMESDYEMVDYEPLLELRRFLRQEPRPDEYEWDEDDEDDEWEEFEDQDDLVSRQNSVYFREVFSSPHENLRKNLKIVKGSPLKQMQNVNETSPGKA